MPTENTSKKLIELLSKAVMTNEELLNEEKKFIQAVAGNEDDSALIARARTIANLFRKEGLFIGAAQNLLIGSNNP